MDISIQKDLSFGLEFPIVIGDSYSPVLKRYWGEAINNPLDFFTAVQNKAFEIGADFVSVYFNVQEPDEPSKTKLLEHYKDILKNILIISKIPVMIKLSSVPAWDFELADALSKVIDRDVIFSPLQAANYDKIISLFNDDKFSHKFVLRTPIDINLTKELNILSIDAGLSSEQILIDPDMGCIGYGIDYGYSIIERICLARKAGDKMLDMPIIVYAGEESFKAKESKSADFDSSWGDLFERAKMWEISTASSLIAAGASSVVLWHPESIRVLKFMYGEAICH